MGTTRDTRHGAIARILLLLPLLSGACATPSPQAEVIEVDCERFSATAGDQVRLTRWVSVGKGATVVVRLCSNPSTGFGWGEAVISSSEVLTQQARDYVPPQTAMPGAAGMEQWRFLAVGQGQCTVSLSYTQPWDGGEAGAREFELHVEVV